MTRITILGGTGYAGRNIAQTAVAKGHDVVSYSRNLPADPIEGVDYRTGDFQDDAVLQAAVDGSDVIVSAVSPRGELAGIGKLRAVEAKVAQLAAQAGVRFGVVGGAGSLRVSENGPLVVDTPDFPGEFKDEARELGSILEDLRASDTKLDWFFLSPAGGFGAYAPGESTGHYRLGEDQLIVDDQGNSFISGADYALAFVDEIEKPAHHRARFTVAY